MYPDAGITKGDVVDFYRRMAPRLLSHQRDPLATLLYLVTQGTLTFHIGFSRIADLDWPDFVLFDLDPGQAGFTAVVAVAKTLRGVLRAEGSQAFVKTSDKTGLHVCTPWRGRTEYDEACAEALGIARRVVGALPDRATVEWWVGKVVAPRLPNSV
jgi:bifunctional non-homologous end joining protein LigD